ncbi:hypothetical protein MK079_00790 [Candidatus Gracilibacteria bacterium]|nr:hypothetical protein [Candidatus Gracilibacteria bacterium]
MNQQLAAVNISDTGSENQEILIRTDIGLTFPDILEFLKRQNISFVSGILDNKKSLISLTFDNRQAAEQVKQILDEEIESRVA